MKHNNVLPNQHFRKDWQFRVKVHLNQAKRKEKRRAVRKAKALAKAPAPLRSLRPAVHCPTQRYNMRVRAGRGFTLEELKAAGLHPALARARGIAVDFRRRNRSAESLQVNTDRLKAYLARVVLNPKADAAVPQIKGAVAKIVQPKAARAGKITTMAITEEMRKEDVVRKYKQAIAVHKLEGKRRFKKDTKEEGGGGKADAGGDAGGDDA